MVFAIRKDDTIDVLETVFFKVFLNVKSGI